MTSMNPTKELLTLLKAVGMEKEEAITLSLRVRRPEHEPKMIQWLRENPDATPMEAVLKSREIVGRA